MARQTPAEAKKPTNKLTAAEVEILQQYLEVLEGNRVCLTKTLEREQYERTKLILERLGGVYMVGHKVFSFDVDPSPLIARTLELKQLPEKNPLDFFWSPPPVTEALLEELECGNTMQDLLWLYEQEGRPIRMIELSAGLGHLADAFRARYPMAIIDVCEIDPFRCAVLQSKGYRVVAEDAFDYYAKPADFYDVALLNPPFSIRGDTFTFIKFIEHAYDMLCDNEWSKLVSVVPAQFSTVQRYRDFLIFVLQYGRYGTLPEGSFAEAGTKWDTSIISLGKRLNHFYATWDEPDTEDGFPNKRVREAWRYISVDQQLGSAEQAIIDDLLEGHLVVYSNGCVAASTRERIWSFCQQVTEHLLKAYQAYIPIKEADYEGMERHILFEYRLQHSQYAQSMKWAWERERERRRDELQATIDKTEKRIRSDRVQLSRSEQELAVRRETLAALEGEQAPTYRPAKQPPPPGDQLTEEQCTSHTAPVVTQDRLQERSHPTRYTQIAFF